MRVWLGLGSNIDREHNIRSAVRSLETTFGKLVLSPVYESAAVGIDGAPFFFNMVVGIDVRLPLPELAEGLRAIETAHGRVRGDDKFAPRTLDIDLLTYGDQVLQREGSPFLPRDEITLYAFVLRPLAEVAGDERHPLTGRCYREVWSEFDQASQPLRSVLLELR